MAKPAFRRKWRFVSRKPSAAHPKHGSGYRPLTIWRKRSNMKNRFGWSATRLSQRRKIASVMCIYKPPALAGRRIGHRFPLGGRGVLSNPRHPTWDRRGTLWVRLSTRSSMTTLRLFYQFHPAVAGPSLAGIVAGYRSERAGAMRGHPFGIDALLRKRLDHRGGPRAG